VLKMKNRGSSVLAMVIALASAPALAAVGGSNQVDPVPASEAQVDDTATPSDAKVTAGGDQDILVTASRRSERLMSVPISVSAIGERLLEDGGGTTTRDLGQFVPGLTTTSFGLYFNPAVRGISSTGSAGDDNNVSLYVDGVYMAAASGNILNLKNVERIEVLKGPQGTLFGRNATGGAIRVFTKDPGQTTEFEATANYGTKLQSMELSVYGATPITSNLALGVTGNVYRDKGYITNIVPGWTGGKFGRTKNYTVRGKMIWTPFENFKVVAGADVAQNHSDVPFDLVPVDRININRNTPGAIVPTEPWTISYLFIPTIKNNISGYSLALEYAPDTYSISSTTAYRTNRTTSELDTDRVNLPIGTAISNNSSRWFQQEVLFASKFAGRFNFILGGFYYYNDTDSPSQAFTGGPVVTPDFQLTSLGDLRQYVIGRSKTSSIAGFASADFQVTDSLKLIAGVRYTTETKRLRTTPIVPARVDLTDSLKSGNVSFRVTAQYEHGGTNLYATYATGFKSATYNVTSINSVQRALPETVNAIEVGLKQKFSIFDFTLAGYHYDYTNIQVSQNISVAGSQQTLLSNAASAKVIGLDAEVTARITSQLRLNAGVAWMPTAKYVRYPGAVDSVPKGYPDSLNPALCPGPGCGLGNDAITRDIGGTRLPRAPKATINIGATYDHEFAGGELQLTANFYHNSGFVWAPGAHVSQRAYSLLNGTLGWSPANGNFRFSVWGRNLTNTYYQIYNNPNTTGVSAAYAAPREIGLSIDFKL
jgi:iron complex outermembrane receptor protein